jgi:hypothetical protein
LKKHGKGIILIEEILGKDFDFTTLNLSGKDKIIPDSKDFVV